MITAKDFEGLDHDSLVDLLGKLTKEYTSELTNDPKHIIDDEVYSINLLIKEIEIREKSVLNKNNNVPLRGSKIVGI